MKKTKAVIKKYLIPHEGNEKKPHLLRPRTVAFVLMVALVAESAFVLGAKYIIPQSKLFGIIQANVLVDETNQNRVENNLSDLQVSPLLQAVAQLKANDMATKGYFAHTSPQGLTPWYWFAQVGYNFDYAGENLAVNFSDSQDVTTAWMNSPEHRANILSVNFTQIGIATADGVYNGQPATFVVEEFGTPVMAATPFVDTASAASIPAVPEPAASSASAPASSPVAVVASPTTAAPAPVTVKKSAPVVLPAPVAVVPVVVAMQNAQTTSSEQSFVAVKGASIQASQLTTGVPAMATSSAATPAATAVTTAAITPAPAPQSNLIQQVFSNPKAAADDFYFFLMALFLIALVLNIFIDIRVQFPRLIASGVLVVVVAGLCVMLNQNIGLIHAVVL